MSRYYRIVLEEYDTKPTDTSDKILLEGDLNFPSNCLEIGIDHTQQITLIQKAQDIITNLQGQNITFISNKCYKCKEGKLRRYGYSYSCFSDVFTDHKIKLPKRQCNKCKHIETTTIKSLFGQALSGELLKIQSELGARHSYRESEELMSLFANKRRSVNNHEQIHITSESVGQSLDRISTLEEEVISVEPADELIVHVDGGHINSTCAGERSFEAMTAAIYNPKSLIQNNNNEYIISDKHCAASSLSDAQNQMKKRTMVAALKQGISSNTKVTALCDGADNCWNIIDALEPISGSVERILDWFHLSMKIHNISLVDQLKDQLLKVKWYLWRGNINQALNKLDTLINKANDKSKLKLKKLFTYIKNNSTKIVNYEERKNNGMPFTSNLAESTVESLINQRCKGQQHMRWSRNGLDPILQLRAAIASNDWNQKWPSAVLSI